MPKNSIILICALTLALLAPVTAIAQPAAAPATSAAADGQFKEQIEKAKKLRNAGSDADARKILESVLPPLRSQGPSQDLVDTLNNLSDIATMSGEYDHAVQFSRESTTACQNMRDKNCEAQAHSDAGLALSNAGNYDDAATELDLGLKLTTETKNPQTAVLILNNLGVVYYYQAKYSEALRTYESALQYVEKAEDKEWAATWRQITQLILATLYQRLGNYRPAIAIYTDIIAHPKKLSPRDVGHIDANLGAIYRHLGDSDQALLHYHYANDYYAKEKDTDGELAVLKNTGIVLALQQKKLSPALVVFGEGLALAKKTKNQREVLQTQLYRGDTLYLMGRLREAEREYSASLASADQLGTVEEQWKAVYGMGKIALSRGQKDVAEAKFRDAIKRIESVRSQLQFSLTADFFVEKRDVYDALIKLLLERNDAASAFEFMERSRARVFQDRFFGGNLSPDALSLHFIQGRLDAKTALIEFWAGTEELAAVWVTRDSVGITQTHISAADMDLLGKSVSGLPDNLGKDWQKGFQRISAMLPKGITPFSDSRYNHVLIVPDGFLSLVPFELLPTDSGKPLLESRDVAYLPSAVLLLRGALKNASAIRLPWQQQFVGFGDPQVIGSGESSLTSAREGMGPLPASGEEIRTIARLSAGRVQLFLGPRDQKRSFFESARSGAALLHVSTHAVADMDDPERSRLLFSPDEAGQPNNYIFLKELYGLDLRGMSLATLSACDTERGRLVPGEGIQAFSRALLAAGSRSALTTLWRVPDQPTSEFMQHFYYYLLKKHKSKSEALRLTKLEFLHSGTALSHPRFWAAFVLNGDGTEPVPRFIPWQALAMPFPVLALIIFFYLRMRKKKQAAAATA
ncbi:MAG TPA: CHAT domain-containing tetratricopeptide repeat protein [Candidatus Angelobacter sp.]|nr:CHAT domain-containing tetratricopeptide repeat protein [Candidatus Angelobacter sp.]